MNLLCLASETSAPGADEFVPVLVYVVIHSNPPDLLSTMQYVTDFYDKRLRGEEAYYWMQFCAAIAFIKTLRSDTNWTLTSKGVSRNSNVCRTGGVRLDGEIRLKYFDHFLFPIKELYQSSR